MPLDPADALDQAATLLTANGDLLPATSLDRSSLHSGSAEVLNPDVLTLVNTRALQASALVAYADTQTRING